MNEYTIIRTPTPELGGFKFTVYRDDELIDKPYDDIVAAILVVKEWCGWTGSYTIHFEDEATSPRIAREKK